MMESENIIPHLWWKATIGYDDMREAAEFEARVAARLASWETLPVPCMNDTYCDRSSLVCPSCRLKYARLQVEEEMDADIQAKD